MNTTFKIGDTVELIERYEGYAAGSRAVIYHTDETYDHLDGGQMLCLDMEDGNKVEGMFSKRAKLVETKAHEYKEGDRVQVTIPAGNDDWNGGAYFQTGTGTVDQVHSNGKRLLVSGTAVKDGSGPWWVDKKFVTPLAVELPFEVGARVRSKAGYLDVGSEGTVTRLEGDFGGDIEIDWDKGYAVAGLTLGARRSGLEVIASPVVERPKAIPATDTKPQIGDTIVAFWGDLSKGEVETRAKGVVARIDEDGNYEAADGSCIDWDEEFSPETSDSVFIVERAPKPEPVKVLPEQKFIDAPVGSIAYNADNDFKWLKTANNEWSLYGSDNVTVLGKDRNDETVWVREGYSKLYTFS